MTSGRWSLALLLVLVASTAGAVGRAQERDVPGRVAFVRDGGIWIWENGETSRLLEEEGVSDARWSPDGESILFVRTGDSYSDLVTISVQTSVPIQLTFNQPTSEIGSELYAAESVWALDPSWSASGLIGFVSDAPGGGTLFMLWLKDGPDGEPYPAPLLTDEGNLDSVSLAGDGSLAAYVVRQPSDDGTYDINVWLRDLSTGETFLAAQSQGEIFDPAMSPDGRSVAVAIREPDGPTDVWVVDRATLERSRVTRDADALAPTWSSDGEWLAFLKLQDYEFEVWGAPVGDDGVGRPFKLFGADELDSRSGLSWWVPPTDEP